MDKYCVYKHTCPNGKTYVGITSTNPINRWREGKGYYRNQHFYNAILKYGWDNIRHEILFSDLTKDEAYEKEIELIAKYKSNDPEFGYNFLPGGNGCTGFHLSEETKEKLRRVNLGKKASEETRRKMSIQHLGNQFAKGNKLSDETKRKMSEAAKGEKNAFYGKHHSEETRQKMKEAWKRRKENARKVP